MIQTSIENVVWGHCLEKKLRNRVSTSLGLLVLLLPFQNCGKFDSSSPKDSAKTTSGGTSNTSGGDSPDTSGGKTPPPLTPLPPDGPDLKYLQDNCRPNVDKPTFIGPVASLAKVSSGWAQTDQERNQTGHKSADEIKAKMKIGILNLARHESLGCQVDVDLECKISSTKGELGGKPINAVGDFGQAVPNFKPSDAIACDATASRTGVDTADLSIKIFPKPDDKNVRCVHGTFTIKVKALTETYGSTKETEEKTITVEVENTCPIQQSLANAALGVTLKDAFGTAVAIQGDTAAVIADGDDTGGLNVGAVYVFKRNSGVWASQGKLIAPPASVSVEAQPQTVSLGGDFLAYGSGSQDGNKGIVHLFSRTGAGAYGHIQDLKGTVVNGRFGSALVISGNRLIVGAPSESGTGKVYVYTLGGAGATFAEEILPPTSTLNQGFGSALAASSVGLVIGAPQRIGFESASEGNAYFLAWSGAIKALPLPTAVVGKMGSRFGASVAIYESKIAVGAPRYANNRNTEGNKGYVAYYSDATAAAVGIASTTNDAHYGTSLGLNKNGIFIGGPELRADTGAVDYRLYGSLTKYTRIFSLAASSRDAAGSSLAVNDKDLLVGAFGRTEFGAASGGAFTFVVGE